jgi:hypothetical protein
VPHVMFVHGIGNKIEPELLERAWVDSPAIGKYFHGPRLRRSVVDLLGFA